LVKKFLQQLQASIFVEIFKEFEYLHNFKLQSFRTTLNDCLNLGTDELEKRFLVENLIHQFPKKKRAQIKKLIIELLDELKKSKLIESNFNIVLKKGSSRKVEKLTPLLITQSKDIFFSEIICS